MLYDLTSRKDVSGSCNELFVIDLKDECRDLYGAKKEVMRERLSLLFWNRIDDDREAKQIFAASSL